MIILVSAYSKVSRKTEIAAAVSFPMALAKPLNETTPEEMQALKNSLRDAIIAPLIYVNATCCVFKTVDSVGEDGTITQIPIANFTEVNIKSVSMEGGRRLASLEGGRSRRLSAVDGGKGESVGDSGSDRRLAGAALKVAYATVQNSGGKIGQTALNAMAAESKAAVSALSSPTGSFAAAMQNSPAVAKLG
jgi:hypothetical protein